MLSAIPIYICGRISPAAQTVLVLPDDSSPPKRKRQKLNNLTVDEKIHIRKLKNREAAQNARDKQKAKMHLLERRLAELRQMNVALRNENRILREKQTALAEENQRLVSKAVNMDTIEDIAANTTVEESSDSTRPLEHASFPNVPLQKEWGLALLYLLQVVMLSSTQNSKLSEKSMNALFTLDQMMSLRSLSKSIQPQRISLLRTCPPKNYVKSWT